LASQNAGSEGHPPATATSVAATPSAAAASARNWLALIDAARWTESWDAASSRLKTQLSAAQWQSTMANARGPLGVVSSRTFQSESRMKTLPGLPDGDYDVVQFQTSFAKKSAAIETVALMREGAGWKAIGYFIR
jgi:hypothetical protein